MGIMAAPTTYASLTLLLRRHRSYKPVIAIGGSTDRHIAIQGTQVFTTYVCQNTNSVRKIHITQGVRRGTRRGNINGGKTVELSKWAKKHVLQVASTRFHTHFTDGESLAAAGTALAATQQDRAIFNNKLASLV